MNKLMAILLGMGAVGVFGLSQRGSFQSQSVGRYGNPIGEVHIHDNSRVEKFGYTAIGAILTLGCFYFISRVRRDDLLGK